MPTLITRSTTNKRKNRSRRQEIKSKPDSNREKTGKLSPDFNLLCKYWKVSKSMQDRHDFEPNSKTIKSTTQEIQTLHIIFHVYIHLILLLIKISHFSHKINLNLKKPMKFTDEIINQTST